VLSPDALESPNCRQELEVAVAGGKRIRPVLHRAVAAGDVPPALRRPQWIDLSDRSPGAVDTLAAALEVDPEWVESHTRLLVRAQEWDRRLRDASFLLRGSDLRAAESWLAGQAGKDPPPTPLQSEYVLAGRAAATRRQRAAFGAVATALAVATGLAVFAFVERSQALHDASIARSRELAALSLGAPTSDGRRVLEQALEAVDEATTPEAEDALRHALVRSREVGSVTGALAGTALVGRNDAALYACPDGSVGRLTDGVAFACARRGPYREVAFTPDGDRAYESGRRTGRVLDTTTGATLATVPARAGQTHDGLALTPDARWVLMLGASHVFRLWHVPSRPGAATLVLRRRRVQKFALSPGGGRFATAGRDGLVRVWSTRTQKPSGPLFSLYGDTPTLEFRGENALLAADDERFGLWTLTRPPRTTWLSDSDVEVSADRRFVAARPGGPWVEVRTLAKPAKRLARVHRRPSLMSTVSFSPDASLLVDESEVGVDVWTTATGRHVGRFANAAQQPIGASVSSDDRMLLTDGLDGVERLWRISPTPELRSIVLPDRRLADGDPTRPEAVANDVRRATVTLDDGTILVVDRWTGGTTALGPRAWPPTQALAADGRHAAAYDGKTIRVWDSSDRGDPVTIPAPFASGLAFDADGGRIAAAVGGKIEVWSTADGSVLASLAAPYAYRESDSADGLELHLASDRLASGSGHLYDLASRGEIPLERPWTGRSYVAFNADGKLLAAATTDDVRLFRASDGSLVRTLTGHEKPLFLDQGVTSVAFSPDGRVLLTTGADQTTRIWTVATGDEEHVVHERFQRDHDEAPVLSPDGAVFAAYDSEAGGISVWSVESGTRLLTVKGATSPFAFTPDGARIVTAAGRALRVYGCDACGSLERLRALARKRLGES